MDQHHYQHRAFPRPGTPQSGGHAAGKGRDWYQPGEQRWLGTTMRCKFEWPHQNSVDAAGKEGIDINQATAWFDTLYASLKGHTYSGYLSI